MPEFSTTSQVNVSQGVKVLVYGDSGMGKTMMCATAPAPYILSAEGGTLSLSRKNLERLHGVGNPHITYDIPVAKIVTVDDLTYMHNLFATNQDNGQFKTICIDSITEIGEVVLSNAKRTVKDPRQAYGELIEKMLMTVKAFRDLPGRNVFITAKMEPMKDETTGIVKNGPSMPGQKLGPALPYYFDEVLKLGVNKDAQGNPFRYLQTVADLQNIAKDRSGALDPMEPPHLAHVFNKILQGV